MLSMEFIASSEATREGVCGVCCIVLVTNSPHRRCQVNSVLAAPWCYKNFTAGLDSSIVGYKYGDTTHPFVSFPTESVANGADRVLG